MSDHRPPNETGARDIPPTRKGQGDVHLDRAEFERRYRDRFYDPAFAAAEPEIERVIQIAWEGYDAYRKNPRKQRAGEGFADPEFEVPIEWLAARERIRAAQVQHDDRALPDRVLLICGSPRSDETCPGEMSKTFRLVQLAKEQLEARNVEVDLLDLSLLTSQFGRTILPCKACVSTAMPLCHWPCSCYPNYAMGQVNDWMNDLYPRFVAAHGIFIITPVHWYQVPSVLKLLIDRLVCADGGNPDITSTHGKDTQRAKALEMQGWDYPRHLQGRAFAVAVHGDAIGAETVRRSLTDWLTDMQLVESGAASQVDGYIGYYEPYATNHEALDKDEGMQNEVRNAARALAVKVTQVRQGYREPDAGLADPRPK